MPVCMECREEKRNGGGNLWGGGGFVCMDCMNRRVSHQAIDLLAAASTRCDEHPRRLLQRLIPRIRTGAARVVGENHDSLRARTSVQIRDGAETYEITIRDALVQIHHVAHEPDLGYSMSGTTGDVQIDTGQIDSAPESETFEPDLPHEVPEPPPVGTVGMWDGSQWLPVESPAPVPANTAFYPSPPQEPEEPPVPRGERLKNRIID